MFLQRRSRQKTSEFIFPAGSKTGYIYDPKKAVLKVAELSGVPFTLHDLRRIFATIAEGLDLPSYALKCLLNHQMNNDVTAGYIMIRATGGNEYDCFTGQTHLNFAHYKDTFLPTYMDSSVFASK